MSAVSDGGQGESSRRAAAHAAGRRLIGEPDAGNPHVRFDEGKQETCVRVARLSPTLRGERGGSPCTRLKHTEAPERDERSGLLCKSPVCSRTKANLLSLSSKLARSCERFDCCSTLTRREEERRE